MSPLSKFFPEIAGSEVSHVSVPRGVHSNGGSSDGKHDSNTAEELSTRWRTILSLEVQGLNKTEIARMLGTDPSYVARITNDERYVVYRNEYLSTIDHEFLAMKPLAFRALHDGLTSDKADIALKASDQWFRAASFGGYAKNPEPARNVTAEDVVKQLLHIEADNVQININTEK